MDQPSERLRIFRGTGAFQRARAAAEAVGLAVGGTYEKDGKRPVYFLHKPGAADHEIEAIAFFVREGREIGPERQLIAMADALRRQGRDVPDFRAEVAV